MERLLHVACHPRRKQHTISYSPVHLQILSYRVGTGVSFEVPAKPVVRNLKGVLIGLVSSQAQHMLGTVPGKFFGIVGQDPSVSRSSRLRVDIFQFCFVHLMYIQ